MRIVDLVAAWNRTHPPATEPTSWHGHDAELLAAIERQRVPEGERLHPPAAIQKLTALAADPTLHAELRAVVAAHGSAGWPTPQLVALFAAAEPGSASEIIFDSEHDAIVLFVDRVAGDRLIATLIAAIAQRGRLVHRVREGELQLPTSWNRWEAARELPLSEWIYGAGLGIHAVAERFPEWSPAELLGVSKGEFAELRNRERALMAELEGELDDAGTGLLLKWLSDDAPPALRRDRNGKTMPRGIGRYLGWRMLRDRVARVGVVAAGEA